MNHKFSVTVLPEKVKLYMCQRHEWDNLILHFKLHHESRDVLCQTFLADEITCYLYVREENTNTHDIFSRICRSDLRLYHIIDIHEDLPGIDHIGIIARISKLFHEKGIPILYVNTYGHNLILLSTEYMKDAMEILERIAYI
jgi:hypothetical protein